MKQPSLGRGFLHSSSLFPDRHALEVDGEAYTYQRLRDIALSIAATLQARVHEEETGLTAVLAHRSVTAFSGILGILLRGHGYVPLHPEFPVQRISAMLSRAGCRSLVVGDECLPMLNQLLEEIEQPLSILLPDSKVSEELRKSFPIHSFIFDQDMLGGDRWEPVDPAATDTAYLLFTSGSTGIPKGVQVSHRNICYFIDVVKKRYDLTEHDRFSQMFELVFDLSLFDLFVAWDCGACVCCPSKGDARLPAKYIRESGISVWFSVPSLALAMKKMRMLRPDFYPKLRVSLFCGEALLNDIAEAWAQAAPNSMVENLYGPTEVTLACLSYRWRNDDSLAESAHGLVPIGEPFPGMTAIICNEELYEVTPGEEGELLMSGPQVAIGYLNDRDKTEAAFTIPPGKDERYYRTGDLVRRSGERNPIQYLGRIDHQIKIRGNRIELGEIEAVIRSQAGVEVAVALGWPVTEEGVEGIVAFVQGADVDHDVLLSRTADRLPSYMVPKEIRQIEEFPLNQNGKIDRKALLQLLNDNPVQHGIRS